MAKTRITMIDLGLTFYKYVLEFKGVDWELGKF